MSARIFAFRAAPPTSVSTRLKLAQNSGPIIMEVPVALAQRIADAAVWVPKTPEQLALDTLQEAFPEKKGAA